LFATSRVAGAIQIIIYLTAEVLLAMQFVPDFLVARTSIRGLVPFVPLLRMFIVVIWPLRALLELGISLAHISEDVDPGAPADRRSEQEGIEALVEAAQEEGILEQDEADLIEQVVEFGDKRVRELMTPRPDIVATSANATPDELRRLFMEMKFSRIPVYEESLDDVFGVVHARDLLLAPQGEGPQRTIRELARPILIVPETKSGSTLLKEMQQKHQHLAIVVDEYGSVAGLVTLEDLVEEIVGEIGEEHRHALPEVVRESDGGLVLRGSVGMERLHELLGLDVDEANAESSTTVAGLLNSLAGHVPVAGEKLDYGGVRFEVLEANQRKVLRLRARRHAAAAAPKR
jgi:CBS domain containing-hemolysin-like protein